MRLRCPSPASTLLAALLLGAAAPGCGPDPGAGGPDGGAPAEGADLTSLSPVPAGSFSGRYRDPRGRSGRYVGWVPAGLVHPGALVYLHADDGGDDYASWIDATTRGLAEAHGMIAVSVQEPDDGCWWAPLERTDASFLGDLVREVLVGARQVDPARVVLAGKSGGGFFAAGVPALLGFPFGGAVIGLCGADVPRLDGGNCDTDEDAPAADVPLRVEGAPAVRYWFATTAQDEYRPYSVDAADAFRAAGAEVTLRDVGPGGHCAFDLLGELGTALDTLRP